MTLTEPMPQGSPIANLRDFGGQKAHGNSRVRRGLLFRSGSLSALAPEDHARLDQLGLRAIVDLRSVMECENHPSEWTAVAAAQVHSPISDTKAMLREIFSGDIDDPQVCHSHFSHFYAQIPELYADDFSKMFALLAQGDVPLLVNCSAGKDRTGVAAALVLHVLGVAKSDIFADYLLTNERLKNNPAFMQMLSGRIMKNYASLPPAAQNVLMSAHEDHLNAAFAQIESTYGGVSQYLETRLSISQDQQGQIRAALTEPA
jgi:protein-tyrosine phosphatase